MATLRMDQQRGRVVLLEFWDFCRVNSLRTLPYLKVWHERYGDAGLRIIGVHTGAFPPSRDEANVRRAVERLEIPWAVAIDTELEIWDLYGNRGWPARYLWDRELALHSLHYGEGAYQETEREIQALLDVERSPVAPLRPEDAPGALIAPQSEDVAGAYSGPYEAGAVWAVVDGAGTLLVDGRELAVREPGCFPVVEHARHTAATLTLEPGPGVTVHATCFTPGLAR
ncbi:MAG TPA: DipZ protein [Solirubrobacter sp.]|nr:DipZ protein [Solirubrobacter sp.]